MRLSHRAKWKKRNCYRIGNWKPNETLASIKPQNAFNRLHSYATSILNQRRAKEREREKKVVINLLACRIQTYWKMFTTLASLKRTTTVTKKKKNEEEKYGNFILFINIVIVFGPNKNKIKKKVLQTMKTWHSTCGHIAIDWHFSSSKCARKIRRQTEKHIHYHNDEKVMCHSI